MSPIATLKQLIKAAARSETIFFVDDSSFENDKKNLPPNCVGYKVVPTKDGGKELGKLMSLCVNKKGNKMLGSYTLSSRDPAVAKSVVVYFTSTMMCRWSEGTSQLPAKVMALVAQYSTSAVKCDVANDDDEETAPEAPADE
jgi:hypothetical protein